MDTSATTATFLDATTFTLLTTTDVWSAGDTILTCTPIPAFPANRLIFWGVSGSNPNGDPLGGVPGGSFTTGTGSSTGGSGTNAITSFSVGKVHHYQQTSPAAATLDPFTPYGFSGAVALASNRSANTITLTNSTTAIYSLFHLPPPQAEIFLLATNFTSLSTFDAAFPSGNYSFFVQANTNQTVVVNLPDAASQPQPAAPRIINYVAAQIVNPNQPFILAWDAFPGGTASDYIDVDIGIDVNLGSVYGSPNPGLPGALNGTATTFTIPAGTLQPDTVYPSQVGFFRQVGITNANYATAAYRATYTAFNLITGSAGAASLVLTNAVFDAGSFRFEVVSTNAQTVIVEYRTNLSTGQWQTLLTTNTPLENRFQAVAPQAATNRFLFFRARLP